MSKYINPFYCHAQPEVSFYSADELTKHYEVNSDSTRTLSSFDLFFEEMTYRPTYSIRNNTTRTQLALWILENSYLLQPTQLSI